MEHSPQNIIWIGLFFLLLFFLFILWHLKNPMGEKNYNVFVQKEAELQYLIGIAITSWSKLEFQILKAFAYGSKMDFEESTKILAPVIAFKLQLEMTDIAVRNRLAETDSLKHWISIIEYVRELSGDRNYIVHMPLIASGSGHPAEADWANAEPQLGPSIYAYFSGSSRQDPIRRTEIKELIRDFEEATQMIDDFLSQLVLPELSGKPLPDKFQRPISRRRPPRKKRQAANRK